MEAKAQPSGLKSPEDRGEGAGERRPFLALLGEMPGPAAVTVLAFPKISHSQEVVAV